MEKDFNGSYEYLLLNMVCKHLQSINNILKQGLRSPNSPSLHPK